MKKNNLLYTFGFTLIELMVVVAIIAFLSMIAAPRFLNFLAKAKRTEAYLNLSSIYTAQKVHWAENGTYSTVLNGPGSIGWQPEGKTYYSYGFPGQANKNFFEGKWAGPKDALSKAKADKNSFTVVATAYIKDEKNPDTLMINEKNEITIVNDGISPSSSKQQKDNLIV